MLFSNKLINLSKLFDLLTLSVVYGVSNCFLETFTSTINNFLNVRKSSKELSSDLLESLLITVTLLVTSFSFIITRWYSLSYLLPVRTIRLLSCSTGIPLAVISKFFFQVHLVSQIALLLTSIKDF